MPSGDSTGVDKKQYFKRLWEQRLPTWSDNAKAQRRQGLKDAWASDGLKLSFNGDDVTPEGNLGNSTDAQRLIMLAREQGVEDQMIEAIYTANHEKNECLSDFKVLLAAAEQAGVRGAEEMLASDWGKEETLAKIHEYLRMGINAVPVIIIQGQQPIMGAPEKEFLAEKIAQALGMSARSTGEVEAAAL